MPLLPFEGRRDDREGRPKALRFDVAPLGRTDQVLGRSDVLIVLVDFGWRDIERAFSCLKRDVVVRLGSRRARNGCIEARTLV